MAEGAGRRPRLALAAATVAYLLFVAYQSLAGGGAGECRLPLLQQGQRLSLSDGLANLVAYLPLGLLAAAWLAPRRSAVSLAAGLAAIAGFSLAMELLQACMPARVSSWFDLAMNSAGGLAGLLLMSRVAAPGHAPVAAPGHAPVAAAIRAPLLWPVLLVTGAWLALALAPWRFTLDVGTIRSNLAFLLHWADWGGPDPWRFARHFFGWLAVAVALRAIWRGRAAASLALALAIGAALVGQVLLVWRALSYDELAAVALAAALAFWMPSRSAGPVLARLLPLLALVSVGAYQLAPGRGGVHAGGFEWLPQLGRGSLLPALELSLMFGWLAFSLLLSLRWLQQCGVDIARRRVVLPGGVVGLMLASEVAQAWIPGRVPDSSAPLLTGLAFAVAWALFGRAGDDRPIRDRARPTSRRPAA
ncbi:VanZ family protein [Zeimonas arvi]|nr:VanZ family protein [Zeimonas arvi]